MAVETVIEEYSEDAFLTPKGTFYIRNALGQIVWLKTRSRVKAQETIDELYGSGRYTVRTHTMAKGAADVTVRATATRRGQYVQSQRARILNS